MHFLLNFTLLLISKGGCTTHSHCIEHIYNLQGHESGPGTVLLLLASQCEGSSAWIQEGILGHHASSWPPCEKQLHILAASLSLSVKSRL